MKIIKTESPFLSKPQWRKVFTATSIIILSLYVVAMICSALGSKYFIHNYQNTQMDNIEAFLSTYSLMPIINFVFSTIEFSLVSSFILNKRVRFWYPLAFYLIRIILSIPFAFPAILDNLYPFFFYIPMVIIEQFIDNKKFSWKLFGKQMLRLLVAIGITFILQFLIYAIKTGMFSVDNHVMNLSATFIYAMEYDIALAVILFTVLLYINREKGDSTVCTTSQHLGGFSQTSKMKSLKSSMKTMTKTQKNKIRWLYFKLYLTQLGGFLLIMILPFLLGKVVEFLLMYLAFAIVRYLLGFKYSLHYKKETLCITVGVVVFGILALAVPFFYVTLIVGVSLGVSLAILLHLSYKYKALFWFNKIARPDKFAELYVLMDGDLTKQHVGAICNKCGLDKEEIGIMIDFSNGEKKSYIARKYHYSEKTIERKINECLDRINENC